MALSSRSWSDVGNIAHLALGAARSWLRRLPRFGMANARASQATRIALEMAILFCALLAVDHVLLSGQAFGGLNPNPYWLPVILMAVGYGSSVGLLSAGIATLIWFLSPHPAVAGDHLQQMLHLSIQPLAWFLVALVVGEVSSYRISRIGELTETSRKLEVQRERLAETIGRLMRRNRTFQVRIATEERTVGQAIEIATSLIGKRRASQLKGLERMIALAAQTEDFTYYRMTGDRLVAHLRGKAAEARADELASGELDHYLISGIDSAGRPLPSRIPEGMTPLSLTVRGEIDDEMVGMLVLHSLCRTQANEAKVAELDQIAQALAKLDLQSSEEADVLFAERPLLFSKQAAV